MDDEDDTPDEVTSPETRLDPPFPYTMESFDPDFFDSDAPELFSDP
jgi:hypothetical protein